MSTPHGLPDGLPTPEQLGAARAFVTARRQRGAAGLRPGRAKIATALDAWSGAVDQHLARAEEALARGEAGEAARAWAVALEGLAAWSTHPGFPSCLRADAGSARHGG
ncbi:hypothetical protein [Kitasatospora sp. NPDC051914]|uniref:hypothetical protein n=1 Tax=Kitasatospora sp. NPDC051914 TaxID=3154945 RepID=UPI0034206EC5